MAHESHSSNDPYPWGGYNEAGSVPLQEAGALTMMLRYSAGEGEINGERFTFDAGIDGSSWVSFPDRPHPSGAKVGRKFVVRIRDVVEAAYAVLEAEDGG